MDIYSPPDNSSLPIGVSKLSTCDDACNQFIDDASVLSYTHMCDGIRQDLDIDLPPDASSFPIPVSKPNNSW